MTYLYKKLKYIKKNYVYKSINMIKENQPASF